MYVNARLAVPHGDATRRAHSGACTALGAALLNTPEHRTYLSLLQLLKRHSGGVADFAEKTCGSQVLSPQLEQVGSRNPDLLFRMPGTGELGERALEFMGDSDVALLQGRGPLAAGATPWHAFDAACAVEQAAVVFILTRFLGSSVPIPPGMLAALRAYDPLLHAGEGKREIRNVWARQAPWLRTLYSVGRHGGGPGCGLVGRGGGSLGGL